MGLFGRNLFECIRVRSGTGYTDTSVFPLLSQISLLASPLNARPREMAFNQWSRTKLCYEACLSQTIVIKYGWKWNQGEELVHKKNSTDPTNLVLLFPKRHTLKFACQTATWQTFSTTYRGTTAVSWTICWEWNGSESSHTTPCRRSVTLDQNKPHRIFQYSKLERKWQTLYCTSMIKPQ